MVQAAKEQGWPFTDYRAYGRRPRPEELMYYLNLSMRELDAEEEVHAGDWSMFWIHKPWLPQHAACIIGEDRIIHTHSRIGKVIETSIGEAWGARTHSIWRYKWLR